MANETILKPYESDERIAHGTEAPITAPQTKPTPPLPHDQRWDSKQGLSKK